MVAIMQLNGLQKIEWVHARCFSAKKLNKLNMEARQHNEAKIIWKTIFSFQFAGDPRNSLRIIDAIDPSGFGS